MTFEFSAENKKKYEKYLERYDDVQSALLPTLHLAQEQEGYCSAQVISYLSNLMEIAEIQIKEVISFYDMFYDQPTAQNIVQVCTNITCSMYGGREIHQGLLNHFKTKNMKPSADGKIYIQKMECLGACEKAPCMRVNKDYVENITLESAVKMLEDLR